MTEILPTHRCKRMRFSTKLIASFLVPNNHHWILEGNKDAPLRGSCTPKEVRINEEFDYIEVVVEHEEFEEVLVGEEPVVVVRGRSFDRTSPKPPPDEGYGC